MPKPKTTSNDPLSANTIEPDRPNTNQPKPKCKLVENTERTSQVLHKLFNEQYNISFNTIPKPQSNSQLYMKLN